MGKVNKPPSFPMYAMDWLADAKVSTLDLELQGAYMRLLCHEWTERGRLPNDDRALSVLSGLGEKWFDGSGGVLKKFFRKRGNYLFNNRLEIERSKYRAYQRQRSDAGRKSAEIRAQQKDGRCFSVGGSVGDVVQRDTQRESNLSLSPSLSLIREGGEAPSPSDPVALLVDWHRRRLPNCDSMDKHLRKDYEKMLGCGRWTGNEIMKAIDEEARQNPHEDSKPWDVKKRLEKRASGEEREECCQCRETGWVTIAPRNGGMNKIFCSCSNGSRVRGKAGEAAERYKSLADCAELVQLIAEDRVEFSEKGYAFVKGTEELVEV